MSKQSLYEILGISPDATMDQILAAYEYQKKLLTPHQDMEDCRNRLTFVLHAKDVLSDQEKRRQYDRQLAGVNLPSTQDVPVNTAARRPASFLAAVLIIGLFAWGWHQQRTRDKTSAPQQTAPTLADGAAGSNEQTAIGRGVSEAAPPNPQAAPSVRTVTETVVTTSYQVKSTADDAELVKKLVWSVYAVIGNGGLGTGVMVDAEHLLTNCHVLASNVGKGKIYAINAVTNDKAEVTEVTYLDHQDACLIKASGITGKPVSMGSLALANRHFRTHNIGFAQGKLTSSEGYFSGWMNKFGQNFLVTSNYCDHGVSGGPLVDDEGRLVGLTTGGPVDKSYCLSVTIDTINSLKFESPHPLESFPPNYTSNVSRRS